MTTSNFKTVLIMLGYKHVLLTNTFPEFGNKKHRQYFNIKLRVIVNILDKGDVDVYKHNSEYGEFELINTLYPDFDYIKSINFLTRQEK